MLKTVSEAPSCGSQKKVWGWDDRWKNVCDEKQFSKVQPQVGFVKSIRKVLLYPFGLAIQWSEYVFDGSLKSRFRFSEVCSVLLLPSTARTHRIHQRGKIAIARL